MLKKQEFSEVKKIWHLAWPAMIEFAFQTLVQYIDLYMVGTLGVDATAIVGLCSQVQFLLRFPINGMSVGILSVIAVSYGRKEYEEIHSLSLQAIIYALFIGITFSVLSFVSGKSIPSLFHMDNSLRADFLSYFWISYSTTLFLAATVSFGSVLRAIGDMKSPMIINGIVNMINIILNFLLIYKTRNVNFCGIEFKVYGANMGLNGAALGTAVSIALGGIMMFTVVYRNKNTTIKGIKKKVDFAIQKRFFVIGSLSAITSVVTGFGRILFTVFISAMGTIAVAAHSIAYTVESFFYIPAVGIQRAVTTLSGNYLGENNQRQIRKMAKSGVIIVLLLMAGMAGLLFCFGKDVSDLFTTDANVANLSGRVLKIISVSEPLFGLSILAQGMLEGMGETKKIFIWSSVSMWVFRVLLCYFVTMVFVGKLEAAWVCMMADNIFRAFTLMIVFIRKSSVSYR